MEIQDKYSWELYGQGSYLLKTITTEDGGEVRRIVDYPLKDDKQWRFTEITEDKDGYEDTDGWNLTDKEQEEIKNYIRNVLKPSDLYEENEETKIQEKYLWTKDSDDSYLLAEERDDEEGVIRYYRVQYPIEEDNGWHFIITTEDINSTELKDCKWEDLRILDENEKELIKNYIKNILKPNNLVKQSEENKMENMKILNVAVPTELADEVMNIISRFEGVPVDKECSDDISKAENQAEVLSLKEKINLLEEKCEDSKLLVQAILRESKDEDNFQDIFNACFSKELAKEYGVEEYIEQQKYKVSKVTAIQKREIEVLVLEKDDDYSNAEGILEDMNSDEIENLFDNTMDIEYRYEEGNTVADNMTKEQVRNSYSSEELIIADDCQDVF